MEPRDRVEENGNKVRPNLESEALGFCHMWLSGNSLAGVQLGRRKELVGGIYNSKPRSEVEVVEHQLVRRWI